MMTIVHSFRAQFASVSTVPANGDVNPYGVAFVPLGFPAGGTINPGDILVSNFNNAPTTTGAIFRAPARRSSMCRRMHHVIPFFGSLTPPGLTTALNVLQRGFVLVGNFPSTDGTLATATAGSILVIDKNGNLVSTYTDASVQGPWDSALFDEGGRALYFVANGLNGTVVRYDLDVDPTGVTFKHPTVIASGYLHNADPVTFVDAPTGLVYDPYKDVLYVASSQDNAVYAVRDAGDRKHDGGVGKLIYQGSDAFARCRWEWRWRQTGTCSSPTTIRLRSMPDPNQPSELVEFTVDGEFVKEISLDPTPGGSFGLAVETAGENRQAGRSG